jgi:hypothetical protein
LIVVKSFCVLVVMELTEIMFIAIGCMLSIVAFFLKRESQKVERLNEKLRSVEIMLAKNGAKDAERWVQTTKLLEDRRQDVIKIYEFLNK